MTQETGTRVERVLAGLLMVVVVVSISSCCQPKRWIDGDPRQPTPNPDVQATIVATATIPLGEAAE